MDFKEKFKQRLNDLVSINRCTRKSLAKYVGVKANTVSDWLNNGTSPKVEHIYLIAKFFNVSFDYLFLGEDTNYVTLSKEEKELLSYFKRLNYEEKYRELGRLESSVEKLEQEEKNVI